MISREFCQKHYIKIIDDNKRFSRYQPLSYRSFFNYENSMDTVDSFHVVQETEKLLTIEIPESELTRIAEFEEQVFNNMKNHGHHNMFEILMEQKQNEKQLRETYASVKKAYENYSLMLSLANSGKLELPSA